MRFAVKKRQTKETNIEVQWSLDGEGSCNIDTGIGFFNHMLNLVGAHGLFNIDVNAKGDLEVDGHHTIEDVGIVMGQCLQEALGNKASIKRYSTVLVPMDEALATISIDISGRPYLVFDAAITCERVGNFETEMVEEFFRALAYNAGITLHAKVVYGKNNHHMIEALFKALGRALKEAVTIDERIKGVMSTKGVL